MSGPETAEDEPSAAEPEAEPADRAGSAELTEPAADEPESETGDEGEPVVAEIESEPDAARGEPEAGEQAAADESVPEAAEPISVEAERDAYLADLQRVTAEFANFRRQTIRRNTELVAQAAARLAEALLPVLDACEAAERQGVEGMEPVRSQLVGVLAAEGLEVLDGTDEPFDPTRHEAVMTAEPDEDLSAGPAEPVVVEILRTGYAWKGRVLRPAMVKVTGGGAGG